MTIKEFICRTYSTLYL